MARYAGRVIVHKVDTQGKTIKNYSAWRKKHPKAQVFDSKVEWEVWDYLRTADIAFESQPSLELFGSITTTEFVKPRQTKKAKKEKRNKRTIKTTVQKPIKYTPDYYLSEFDVYIEVKGYADELFKMRWKLFKIAGYDGYVVYSLEEFKELYEQLKEIHYGIC